MKVKFSFVPPGGGEQDYSLEFDLPAIPQQGDYICITFPDEKDSELGQRSFIVRRTWWHLHYSDDGDQTKDIWVEAEFAESPCDSESHKGAIKMYANRGKPAKSFDVSAY